MLLESSFLRPRLYYGITAQKNKEKSTPIAWLQPYHVKGGHPKRRENYLTEAAAPKRCAGDDKMVPVTAAFLWLALAILADAGNILVYNAYFAHSHFVFQAKLADILQEAGHNVTMVIPEFDETSNVYAKKARVVIRAPSTMGRHGSFQLFQEEIWNSEDIEFQKQFAHQIGNGLGTECQRMYEDEEFIEFLRDQKFDFAIAEELNICAFGLFKLLGIEAYAMASPMTLTDRVANRYGLPGRYSSELHVTTDYNHKMPFYERICNFVRPLYYSLSLYNVEMIHQSTHIRKLIGPDFDYDEAIAKARFFFLNSNEHMDFPRPISPKIVYIGGITLDHKIGELNDDYKSIFENSKQGVVMVSFGSLALSSRMPADRRDAILAMFRAFPDISFIWKYEVEDNVAADLPNVYKRKWIPQKELLAHPKLLAIVSHGGMNSVLETCFAGKPMLAIPLFYDQARNAKMLEFRGTAVIVDKHRMTAEALIGSLKKLTQGSTGETFRHRASAIAAMIASKPLSGKERFVQNMNFAVQFKDEEDLLDIGHRHLNFIRYYDLDLYALFATGALMLSSIAFVFAWGVYRTVTLYIECNYEKLKSS